jgi:hypothetical protein
MTTKPMTADDLRAITAASAGLRGLFVHLPATGNVVFSPLDSDELHTIAEDLEPAVAEPLVVMLEGVPRLLAEVARLTQERDNARADVEAADGRLLGVMDGTFSVGDGTAQREIERLRDELESLAPHARDTETEPDAEVLTAPVRCDCCSVAIPAGDSAVMFTDEGGRECWAHYARCPEPEMWYVDWQHREPPWPMTTGWIRRCRMDGSPIEEPYEDALNTAHDRSASLFVSRVRLVRVRKEVTRG